VSADAFSCILLAISNQIKEEGDASLEKFMKLKLIVEIIMDLQQDLGLQHLGLGLWVANMISN